MGFIQMIFLQYIHLHGLKTCPKYENDGMKHVQSVDTQTLKFIS